MEIKKIKNQQAALIYSQLLPVAAGNTTNNFTKMFQIGFTPDVVEVGAITAAQIGGATIGFILWTDLIVSGDGLLCPVGSFNGGNGAKVKFPVNPYKINNGIANFSPMEATTTGVLAPFPLNGVAANTPFMIQVNFIEYDKT